MPKIRVLSINADGSFDLNETNLIQYDNMYFIYNEDISHQIDENKIVFSLKGNYLEESTRVYYNGIRLTLGLDYIELKENKIKLNFLTFIGDNLLVDYNKI